MKTIATIMIALSLCLSAAAQHIQPNGYWWSKISDSRQLGYVEGFNAGSLAKEDILCSDKDRKEPRFKDYPFCIIRWSGRGKP